jgi:hypothetical protein
LVPALRRAKLALVLRRPTLAVVLRRAKLAQGLPQEVLRLNLWLLDFLN